MTSQPFDFTGARGQRLSGVLDGPDGPARGYAVFAHCFTCAKSSLAATRISRALAARGIGVLRFDFTGLGQSEGDFADATFSGDVADLAAAVRSMDAAGFSPSLLVGHSLGGSAVLAAAGDLPEIRAVATIGAPFDVRHVAGQFGDSLAAILEDGEGPVNLGGRPFTVRRGFIDDLSRHDQAARIAEMHRPLLILHAPRDTVVGIDNAQAIFMAARHPKSFVSLDDADHLLTRAGDAVYAAQVIAAWAVRYLPALPVRTAEAAPAAGMAVAGIAASEGADAVAGGAFEGVHVVETGAGTYQVQITAGGIDLFADEPVEAGGLGSGPSPYDLVSAGLGACTAMTLRLHAQRKAWPLERISVTVSHERIAGDAQPDRFRRIIGLEGKLDLTQRARLIEIAERCPVHRTLTAGARVETGERAGPASPQTEAAADHVQAMDQAYAAAEDDAAPG